MAYNLSDNIGNRNIEIYNLNSFTNNKSGSSFTTTNDNFYDHPLK